MGLSSNDSSLRVAVVGTGQIGCRHIQALAKNDPATEIFAFDPSSAALEKAHSLFLESLASVPRPLNRITLVDRWENLPKELDFCVLSTNSEQRWEAARRLMEGRKISYLILEKVLFPRKSEYAQMASLVRDSGTLSWVNYARRLWPGYRKLKEIVRSWNSFELKVHGTNWGLACNGLHFLDLVEFLFEERIESLDASGLEKGSVPSKRPGYFEVMGTLAGRTQRGRFSVTSSPDPGHALTVTVSGQGSEFRILEGSRQLEISLEGKAGVPEPKPFEMEFQSNLTQRALASLVQRGNCELTPFAESVEHHLLFLETLSRHLGINFEGGETCPIT